MAALLGTLALAAPATAATTIGEVPSFSPVEMCGNTNPSPAVAVQTSSAGNPYVVPAGGGVITRWRTTANVNPWYLAVFRPGPGGEYTRIAQDGPRTVDGTLKEFNVQIPVQAGDILGGYLEPSTPLGNGCLVSTSNPADIIGIGGGQPLGTAGTLFTSQQGLRFNVAADVEPDADGDGLGDETQDAPNVTLGKTPDKKTTKTKAKFTFTASVPTATFTCALDGGKFKACTSPYKKKVKPGKHSFQVQASTPAGGSDVLSYRWKVKKKPKK